MPANPHVIVLGLGIAGSSVAAELAARGWRVTAVEQFAPMHERGSSHGDTRIFRRAPHEGAVYVGMAEASYEGWHRWNRVAAEPLFLECGGIDAGADSSAMVQAAEALCREYDQPFEAMDGSAFNRRHPHFKLPGDWRVVYQPRSGVVRPDATRLFLQDMARSHGARLIHDTAVLSIEPLSNGVRARTGNESLEADFLVVAAGSWLPKLLPELKFPVLTERRVMAWLEPESAEPLVDGRLPAFVLDDDGGWYGMPTPDGRVKLGHDKHRRQRIDPAEIPIPVSAEDEAFLSRCAPRYLTGFQERFALMKSCIYTLSEDHHFLIDWHPEHGKMLIFSCCSGHGFKYAPVYGEIAADLIAGKRRDDLAVLRLKRGGSPVIRFDA